MNSMAVVFLTLDLNPILSIILNVPAAIISTIMASRAVRRLSDFTNRGPEVFSYVYSLACKNHRSLNDVICFLTVVISPLLF